jgi:hypothetical protein
MPVSGNGGLKLITGGVAAPPSAPARWMAHACGRAHTQAGAPAAGRLAARRGREASDGWDWRTLSGNASGGGGCGAEREAG